MPLANCGLRSCQAKFEVTGDGSSFSSHDEAGKRIFFCTLEHVQTYDVMMKTRDRVRGLAEQQAAASEAPE